jgi:Flp pilus assembly protein protease CpaA
MSHPVAQLGVATVLLIAGAVADLRKRRIPNALNVGLLAAGVWAQASRGGWGAVMSGLGATLLIVVALWQPWLRGRIGGGDVKMAAAAATWMGLGSLLPYALATMVAGGLVALVCAALSSRQARRQMQTNLTMAVAGRVTPDVSIRSGGGRVSVPYGAAVALGALSVLWGVWTW